MSTQKLLNFADFVNAIDACLSVEEMIDVNKLLVAKIKSGGNANGTIAQND